MNKAIRTIALAKNESTIRLALISYRRETVALINHLTALAETPVRIDAARTTRDELARIDALLGDALISTHLIGGAS